MICQQLSQIILAAGVHEPCTNTFMNKCSRTVHEPFVNKDSRTVHEDVHEKTFTKRSRTSVHEQMFTHSVHEHYEQRSQTNVHEQPFRCVHMRSRTSVHEQLFTNLRALFKIALALSWAHLYRPIPCVCGTTRECCRLNLGCSAFARRVSGPSRQ